MRIFNHVVCSAIQFFLIIYGGIAMSENMTTCENDLSIILTSYPHCNHLMDKMSGLLLEETTKEVCFHEAGYVIIRKDGSMESNTWEVACNLKTSNREDSVEQKIEDSKNVLEEEDFDPLASFRMQMLSIKLLDLH